MTPPAQETAQARHRKQYDHVPCASAFLDRGKSGPHLEENHSVLGPGVASSDDRSVDLSEACVFDTGSAAMPHGITGTLNIHSQAEVVIVRRGTWTCRRGPNGEHEAVGRAGDIPSVPVRVFRGHTDAGDDGWTLTIPGGDDTGGVSFRTSSAPPAGKHAAGSLRAFASRRPAPIPRARVPQPGLRARMRSSSTCPTISGPRRTGVGYGACRRPGHRRDAFRSLPATRCTPCPGSPHLRRRPH